LFLKPDGFFKENTKRTNDEIKIASLGNLIIEKTKSDYK